MHVSLFFFNDTATTEIYTLSLHDALPIFGASDIRKYFKPMTFAPGKAESTERPRKGLRIVYDRWGVAHVYGSTRSLVEFGARSEEHTSELQSRQYLVCRLLLEKKKLQQSA